MDIILENNSIECCKKVWSETLCREETGESVVPDVMPDIGEIIDTDGFVTIKSKEADAGRITISCVVSASILYRPEGDTCVRQLKVNLP